MNAIVPRSAALVSARKRTGHVNVVQCAGEGIAADVRVSPIDLRTRTNIYVVRVASTSFDVIGRLIGILSDGEVVDLGGLSVGAGSIGSARLAVTAPAGSGYETIYLELRSENALMRLEAPRAATRNQKRFTGVKVLLAGIAMCAACVALAMLARPREPVQTTPYPIVARPASAAVAPARILSLSVRRDASVEGETVLASYLAVADSGTIAVIEPGGKVVASAPFTHVGTSRLPIAPAYRAKSLVTRLTVRSGATDAVTSVVVLPAFLTAASDKVPANAPEAVTPIDPAPTGIAFTGIVGVEGRAVAGRLLHVRIAARLASPHIELQDETGATLAERDLASGATRLTLALPFATVAQRIYLVLRYVRNGAEETIVRTIVVAQH